MLKCDFFTFLRLGNTNTVNHTLFLSTTFCKKRFSIQTPITCNWNQDVTCSSVSFSLLLIPFLGPMSPLVASPPYWLPLFSLSLEQNSNSSHFLLHRAGLVICCPNSHKQLYFQIVYQGIFIKKDSYPQEDYWCLQFRFFCNLFFYFFTHI